INRVGLCDHSELMNLRLALDETLVNAIIHGNLGLPSRAKGNSLDDLMQFNNLIKQRSQEAPFNTRTVRIKAELTALKASFTIEDQGDGFDWRSLPTDLEDIELMANHGRGLFLIRAFMSEVRFNDKGNQIILTKHRSEPKKTASPHPVVSN
ncbi:MAG: ATP-binding protein, partial [bacterium]|nr:ATP-binding protein [bacterium]